MADRLGAEQNLKSNPVRRAATASQIAAPRKVTAGRREACRTLEHDPDPRVALAQSGNRFSDKIMLKQDRAR
jgi:hypothetical protein